MIKKTMFFCLLVCITNISLLYSQVSFNEVISFPHKYVGWSFSFSNVKLSSSVNKVTIKNQAYYSVHGICKNQNFGSLFGEASFITKESIATEIVRRANKSSDWLNYTHPCKIFFKIYKIDSFIGGEEYYALIYDIDF